MSGGDCAAVGSVMPTQGQHNPFASTVDHGQPPNADVARAAGDGGMPGRPGGVAYGGS
jgi:hypothetical protein